MLHTSKDMDVGVSLAGLRGGQGAAATKLRRAVQLLERVQQSQQPTKY